eukprot:scaffold66750_cov33-Tisochrysis_lutea.AAC.3
MAFLSCSLVASMCRLRLGPMPQSGGSSSRIQSESGFEWTASSCAHSHWLVSAGSAFSRPEPNSEETEEREFHAESVIASAAVVHVERPMGERERVRP